MKVTSADLWKSPFTGCSCSGREFSCNGIGLRGASDESIFESAEYGKKAVPFVFRVFRGSLELLLGPRLRILKPLAVFLAASVRCATIWLRQTLLVCSLP